MQNLCPEDKQLIDQVLFQAADLRYRFRLAPSQPVTVEIPDNPRLRELMPYMSAMLLQDKIIIEFRKPGAMPRDAEPSTQMPPYLVIHWSPSQVTESEAHRYVTQYSDRLRGRWGSAHVHHVTEVLSDNQGAVLSSLPLGYNRVCTVYSEQRDVGLRLVRLEGGAVGVMGAEDAPDLSNHWSSGMLGGQQVAQFCAFGDERWRTGLSVGRTVYIHTSDDAKGDLVGLMDTPELADRVVGAVNAVSALRALCADASAEGSTITPQQVLRILDQGGGQ